MGKAFKGFPLATSILEGGGKTPWLSPEELHDMVFTMIVYPTTVLFRLTRAIERALEDLQSARQMPKEDAVDMKRFEEIVGLAYWHQIERRYGGPGDSSV